MIYLSVHIRFVTISVTPPPPPPRVVLAGGVPMQRLDRKLQNVDEGRPLVITSANWCPLGMWRTRRSQRATRFEQNGYPARCVWFACDVRGCWTCKPPRRCGLPLARPRNQRFAEEDAVPESGTVGIRAAGPVGVRVGGDGGCRGCPKM
jgi:hypothetical protein